MIVPIPIKGLGKLEQRAYLLLSLAVGGLGAEGERQERAIRAWKRFVGRRPNFKSPLIPDEANG